MYRCMCLGTSVPKRMSRGQRTACGNQFSPYTTWVLGTRTQVIRFGGKHPAEPLTVPALSSAHMLKIICEFILRYCWSIDRHFCFVSQDRISLCSSGCPGTHSVDQAGLNLRDLPASASQVLRLKGCATMPRT